MSLGFLETFLTYLLLFHNWHSNRSFPFHFFSFFYFFHFLSMCTKFGNVVQFNCQQRACINHRWTFSFEKSTKSWLFKVFNLNLYIYISWLKLISVHQPKLFEHVCFIKTKLLFLILKKKKTNPPSKTNERQVEARRGFCWS